MKLLFKNRTQYTKKNYQTYLQFHENRYGTKYRFYTLVISLLIVFCFLMQLKFHYYTLSILVIIGLFIFLLWRFFHPVSEVKKELNSEKFVKEKEFSFRFYAKHIQVLDSFSYYNVPYWKLRRVFETDTFFYLYLDKNHAFLLAKDGFVIGKTSDFSDFIQKKCPLRYQKILSSK